jgi:hypothetical protein
MSIWPELGEHSQRNATSNGIDLLIAVRFAYGFVDRSFPIFLTAMLYLLGAGRQTLKVVSITYCQISTGILPHFAGQPSERPRSCGWLA